MRDRTLDQIVEALAVKTQRVFDTAAGSERYQRLTGRLAQLYGALELARLLDDFWLARRIETHIDALRRRIETD
jgi:hypothetical protein